MSLWSFGVLCLVFVKRSLERCRASPVALSRLWLTACVLPWHPKKFGESERQAFWRVFLHQTTTPPPTETNTLPNTTYSCCPLQNSP